MKLIDITCPKCSATMKVNAELSKCMCSYCGNEMLIDHEIQKQEITNGFDFGYEAEQGRIKAQQEQEKKLEEERQRQQRAIEAREQPYNSLEAVTLIVAAIYAFIIFDKFNIGMILASLLAWLICCISVVGDAAKVKNLIMCLMRGYCLGGFLGLLIWVVVRLIFPIIGFFFELGI